MASSGHSTQALLEGAYLSGGGQCSWEGVAGAGPSWAWLGEARSDRVSHLLEGEAGGGMATSPGASSRAAATHCSAPLARLRLCIS